MPDLGMSVPLQKIKDTIFKKELRADDVVKTMKLKRNQAALDKN